MNCNKRVLKAYFISFVDNSFYLHMRFIHAFCLYIHNNFCMLYLIEILETTVIFYTIHNRMLPYIPLLNGYKLLHKMYTVLSNLGNMHKKITAICSR